MTRTHAGAPDPRDVDRIFSRALGRPAPERAAFADAACADDPALRAAVQRLLEAERASASLFDAAAAAQERLRGLLLDDADDDTHDPWVGARLGPWRLVRRIGRGGMAVVYLGERVDGQYTQQVAVKLLRRPVDAADEVARFRAERQILSSLRHPHIAPLIDGGTTDDGRPFLVTEYVDGLPITEHCARHGLGVDERLALFEQVADAVQHAHRNLVVHRDLKPANVLVDADGRVRLLDFGIAKLLAADGGDPAAPLTRIGHLVMTPEYAAPEQRAGEPVTTATDVYQLGLLLHELLTGTRPPPTDGAPTRPSTLVLRSPPTDAAPAPDRAWLARRLRGDLDVIVQTALQPEPADRYASASALAADLRAHRTGRPIAARPESGFGTLRRLARSHPWASAAAVLAFALVIGWAASVQFYAAELTRQRDAAALQAQRAERAQELLLGLLRRADPLTAGGAGGRDTTVWQTLDAATDEIRATLGSDPATLATLLDTLARLYRAGDRPERAQALLQESIRLHQATAGPASAAVAVALAELGAIERALGRLADGRARQAQALAIAAALPPAQAAQAVPVLLDAGHGAVDDGDARAAASHFERAAALLSGAAAPDPGALIEARFGLGNALAQLGEPGRAEAAITQAVQLTEATFGTDHPRLAGPLSALASAQRQLGRPQEAATTLRRAIALMESHYGPDYGGVLSARNNLALALGAAGDLKGQQRELQAVIAAKRARDGDDHPGLADHYQNLGAALAASGDGDGALRALAQARRLYDAHQGERSPRPAFPRLTEAALHLDGGNATAAAAAAGEAVAILARTLPAGHFARGVGQCLLGEAWMALGRTEAGAEQVRAALPAASTAPASQAHYAERCRRVAQALTR